MDFVKDATDFRKSVYKIKNWKQKVCDLNYEWQSKVMEINYKMTGLSHSSVELTPEQMKSGKPMPTSSNPGQGIRYEALIEKKDIINKDYQTRIERLLVVINEYERILNYIPERDREMIIELYVYKQKNHKAIADDYGYSKRGMYDRVNKVIENAIKSASSEVN